MKSLLSDLSSFLEKGNGDEKVYSLETSIAELIGEALEEGGLFFSLPTNEIVKIIQKSDISNAEMYSNIINRTCEVKGGEAALVLNVVDAADFSRKDIKDMSLMFEWKDFFFLFFFLFFS